MGVLSRPLGTQLLAEIWECDSRALDDVDGLREIMVKATEATGATILNVMFHEFEPQGVSGVVVISESHLTIHTWPEMAYAAVDIFTCGEMVHPWEALEYLVKSLNAEEMHVIEIKRGVRNLRRRNREGALGATD